MMLIDWAQIVADNMNQCDLSYWKEKAISWTCNISTVVRECVLVNAHQWFHEMLRKAVVEKFLVEILFWGGLPESLRILNNRHDRELRNTYGGGKPDDGMQAD